MRYSWLYRTAMFLALVALPLPAAVAAEAAPPADRLAAVAEAGGKSAEETVAAPPRDLRFVQSEKQAIARPGSRAAPPSTAPAGGWSWFARILLYLGFLAGLIWIVLAAAKRYLPGGRSLFSCPAVEVLGRTNLDPRRYVAVVRVGRRVLVVGVGPESMCSLESIGDAVEVTEILQAARPRTAAGRSLFQRLFDKHLAQEENQAREAQERVQVEHLASEVSDLRQRVKDLRQGE